MKEILYQGAKKKPIEYPYEFTLHSADGKPIVATIEDVDDHYDLWLHVLSTGERAKVYEFTSAISIGVVLGEIGRKYESVFAHVVHHRLTIPTVGPGIYEGIPPFP